MQSIKINLTATIPEDYHGKRLDQALAELFPDYSRERIKTWILDKHCLINGEHKRPRDKVSGGEEIVIAAEVMSNTAWQAEQLAQALNIVYEDADIIVLNKPMNCVVHPGSGNTSGTLVNALLQYAPELEALPRAGIVHRLDKDTTGLMVVARSLLAHASLVEQLQQRQVQRGYEAVVNGSMISGGTVDEPIGRSPNNRVKMAVVHASHGKPAITHYRVLTKFRAHTHIAVQLETGRTHQIRVHMEHIRHSIVGDKVYGRLRLAKGVTQELNATIRTFPRQALHAKKLGLLHPASGEEMQWEAPLPQDMQDLLKALRMDMAQLR